MTERKIPSLKSLSLKAIYENIDQLQPKINLIQNHILDVIDVEDRNKRVFLKAHFINSFGLEDQFESIGIEIVKYINSFYKQKVKKRAKILKLIGNLPPKIKTIVDMKRNEV